MHSFIVTCLSAFIHWLVEQVHLTEGIKLSAKVHIQTGPDGKTPERVNSEMYTGDTWADAQIKFGINGKLMLLIIFSSDKARVRAAMHSHATVIENVT